MNQDDFLKQLTSKLDGMAQQHKNKPAVMNHVLENIQESQHSRFAFLKISGFALAAALTGILIFPQISNEQDPQVQTVSAPKLSPQMLEDLEMLMVLGEDQSQHGS